MVALPSFKGYSIGNLNGIFENEMENSSTEKTSGYIDVSLKTKFLKTRQCIGYLKEKKNDLCEKIILYNIC